MSFADCLFGGSMGMSGKQLADAIRQGDAERARELLDRRPNLLGIYIDTALTPLHLAVMHKQHAVLKVLLAASSAARSSGPPGSRPKQHSRDSEDYVNMVRRTQDEATALMLACEAGDEVSVRLLLGAGACPFRRDKQYRRTCLHYAAAKGHASVVEPVVSASLRAPPPVDPAVQRLFPRGGKPLVDLPTTGGCTALMYAARYDHADAVRSLLQAKASFSLRCSMLRRDPTCRATEDSTALHVAALNGSAAAAFAIIQEYFRQKRDVDPRRQQDGVGLTPYQVAKAMKHDKLLTLLDPATDPSHYSQSKAPQPSCHASLPHAMTLLPPDAPPRLGSGDARQLQGLQLSSAMLRNQASLLPYDAFQKALIEGMRIEEEEEEEGKCLSGGPDTEESVQTSEALSSPNMPISLSPAGRSSLMWDLLTCRSSSSPEKTLAPGFSSQISAPAGSPSAEPPMVDSPRPHVPRMLSGGYVHAAGPASAAGDHLNVVAPEKVAPTSTPTSTHASTHGYVRSGRPEEQGHSDPGRPSAEKAAAQADSGALSKALSAVSGTAASASVSEYGALRASPADKAAVTGREMPHGSVVTHGLTGPTADVAPAGPVPSTANFPAKGTTSQMDGVGSGGGGFARATVPGGLANNTRSMGDMMSMDSMAGLEQQQQSHGMWGQEARQQLHGSMQHGQQPHHSMGAVWDQEQAKSAWRKQRLLHGIQGPAGSRISG